MTTRPEDISTEAMNAFWDAYNELNPDLDLLTDTAHLPVGDRLRLTSKGQRILAGLAAAWPKLLKQWAEDKEGLTLVSDEAFDQLLELLNEQDES